MFYSPLRYPGGKNRLSKFISNICLENHIDGHYVEPYAGGASVALYLLLENKVKNITINDFDRSIYAFWHCVLNQTNEICSLIENTEININNWRIAKQIQKSKNKASLLELGFSTLFLNRTNHSGIINAGVIGGIEQKGIYKIDCRFNKKEIIKRIRNIASYKHSIDLFNYDAIDMLEKVRSSKDTSNTLIYLDPPYYLKGASLYMNHYNLQQHSEIAKKIQSIENIRWLVSYDDSLEIKKLYKKFPSQKYSLKYFAYKVKEGCEILFFSKKLINQSAKMIGNFEMINQGDTS